MHYDSWTFDEFEPLEAIGSGSFGLIRKVRRKTDGKILARKEIDYRKMGVKEKEQLVAEVNILKDLKHPNIVEFLERVIDRENSFIYILMEYCEGGDLAAVIKRHKESSLYIPEEFIWTIMTQLTMALHECHCGMTKGDDNNPPQPRAPILHRDLKPDNVFLDANRNVKLGDFGLSRSLTNPQKAFAETYVGTPYYMSPELISESVYDVKSDIWSLGCIIFEMCALKPPFLADSQHELSLKIKMGRIQALPAQYSNELNHVVRSMLQVNPRKRPTTSDLLAAPRIRLCKKQLEIDKRAEELDRRERAISEYIEKYREREATLANIERRLRADEQRLREMETILNSKEETIRSKEMALVEQEKKLTWERQQIEEKRRELIQEHERQQSMIKKALSTKQSSEAMIIDNPHMQEASSSKPSNLSTASKAASLSSQPPIMSTNNTLGQYLATGGKDNLSTGEHMQTSKTWSAPRRKTALSIGNRHLQPSNSHRITASSAAASTANQHTTSDTVDSGGSHTTSRLSSNVNGQQGLSTLGLFASPGESASSLPKTFQGSSNVYIGPGGKESRLSGKFGAGNSNQASGTHRLRAKSRSASTLIASMSLDSGPSVSNINASNSNNTNPFLVPELVKPVALITPSIRASPGISSNTAPSTSFNFTSTLVLPNTSLSSATHDVKMSGIVEPSSSSQQSNASTSNNGGVFLRPAPLIGGSSARSQSQSSQLHAPSFSSRRNQTAGTSTPSMAHIRFNATSTTPSSLNVGSTTSSTAISTTTLTASTTSAIHNGDPSLTANTIVDSTSATNVQDLRTTITTSTPVKTQDAVQSNKGGTSMPPPRIHRPDDDELPMEWDDDIPGPFIRKSHSRQLPPPSSSGSESLFLRNAT